MPAAVAEDYRPAALKPHQTPWMTPVQVRQCHRHMPSRSQLLAPHEGAYHYSSFCPLPARGKRSAQPLQNDAKITHVNAING
jgi:hypothetical protein